MIAAAVLFLTLFATFGNLLSRLLCLRLRLGFFRLLFRRLYLGLLALILAAAAEEEKLFAIFVESLE